MVVAMDFHGFHKHQSHDDNLLKIITFGKSNVDGILDLSYFVNSLKYIEFSMAGARVFQGFHKYQSHRDSLSKIITFGIQILMKSMDSAKSKSWTNTSCAKHDRYTNSATAIAQTTDVPYLCASGWQ